MFCACLIVTYSLKVNSNFAPVRGTFVVPGSGFMSMIYGGIVSLSPPVGACVVLAQECMKNIGASAKAASMSGMSFFILDVCSYYVLDTVDLSQAIHHAFKIFFVTHQEFYITFEETFVDGKLELAHVDAVYLGDVS